jgi:hypothetical protein
MGIKVKFKLFNIYIILITNYFLEDNKFNYVINFNNYVISSENDTISKNESILKEDTFYNKIYKERIGTKKNTVANNLFRNNNNKPIYNLSTRLVNDEKQNKNVSILRKTHDYKFIKTVKGYKDRSNNVYNIIPEYKMSMKKLLNLSNDTFLKLLIFSFDNYENIIKSDTRINDKIQYILCNQFSDISNSFRGIYDQYLQLYEYYFSYDKNSNSPVLYIQLKSKIITDKNNSSFSFTVLYKYENNMKDEYSLSWMVDMRKKSDICFWMASEASEVIIII